MNIVISFVIFLLSLITSGIFNIVGLVDLSTVPFNVWFISFNIIFYIGYKIRFKNKNVLKFFLQRKWILSNRWFYRIDRKMTIGNNHKLDAVQEKAVRLWEICLKDKECLLLCSLSSKERQIESGSVLIILSPNGVDSQVMSIFDSSNSSKNQFYEVRIPQPHLDKICQNFDLEMNRQMRSNELERRDMVEENMEAFLNKHEEEVKIRKSKKHWDANLSF